MSLLKLDLISDVFAMVNFYEIVKYHILFHNFNKNHNKNVKILLKFIFISRFHDQSLNKIVKILLSFY